MRKKHVLDCAYQYMARPYGISVYLVKSKKDLEKILTYYRNVDVKGVIDGLSPYASTLTLVGKGGDIFLIICMLCKSKSALVHECSHAVWKILDRVGIVCDAHNNEAFAYLLQDMFYELGKEL